MKSIAPIVGVVLLVVVAIVVFISDDSSKKNAGQSPAVTASPEMSAPAMQPQASPMPAQNQANVAPGLEGLLGRIEDKVKADPGNIGNRILLAQTYGELGRVDDGIAQMRKIYTDKADSGRTDVVLASLLIKRASPENLAEAAKLLDAAVKRDSTQAGFVYLYRGRSMIAQGKKDEAVKIWKEALTKLPAEDGARTQIEGELSKT